MQHRSISLATALAASLVTAACSDAVAPDTQAPSSLSAALTGSETRQFTSTSFFTSGPGPDGQAFSVYARREGDGTVEGFLIYGTSEMPEPGTYPIGLRGSTPFQLVYTRGVGDGDFIGYAAETGTLVVTSATPKRIEGTFTFEAARYCKVSGGRTFEGPCVPPTTPIPDVPRVTGSGSFSAVSLNDLDDGEEIRRGTIKFYYDPIVIEANQLATSGLVRIRVHTYGGGCVSLARTDARVEGNVIIVEPYDSHRLQRACTDNLVTLRHVVDVQVPGPGTYTVRVIGRQEPGEITVTEERTLLVQ